MPIAMVVHSVIENQFQRERIGFASGPPIRTLPSGEIKTYARRRTAAKEAKLKSQSKRVRIQVFAALALA